MAKKLLTRNTDSDDSVDNIVRSIIATVRAKGDKGIVDYTCQLDSLAVEQASQLALSANTIAQHVERVDYELTQALQSEATRIRAFQQQEIVKQNEHKRKLRNYYMPEKSPRLFGLNKTNRDFSKKKSWGKNQFNSSFPVSLCCYLASKNIDANYLAIKNGKYTPTTISIEKVFGISPKSSDIYFAFEAQHTPFQRYVIGTLPRTDVVIQKESTGECVSGLEIKLTALPDNTTCTLNDKLYGSEIVVRPDTIVYLACSLILSIGNELNEYFDDTGISDWSNAKLVLPKTKHIIDTIEKLSLFAEKKQIPFLLQPVWKTIGKSPILANQCLDIFVWSDAGFTNFISKIANRNPDANSITRQTRTAIWLYKMLNDFCENGKFDHEEIIDNLSYNTKNDKAFASAGNVTNGYMSCQRLETSIISKTEIKNIILGGGQNLLSPERRFDEIIFNSPELFK